MQPYLAVFVQATPGEFFEFRQTVARDHAREANNNRKCGFADAIQPEHRISQRRWYSKGVPHLRFEQASAEQRTWSVTGVANSLDFTRNEEPVYPE
jgi:hypothetical protein